MNWNPFFFAIPLALVMQTSAFVWATPFVISPEKSPLSFEAVGRPSLMKIKGQGARIQGNLDIEGQKLSGVFRVALGDFDTGISLRNEHMRDKYLEVKKYPFAVVEVKDLALPEKWSQTKPLSIDFNGVLTLKNQRRPVQGKILLDGSRKQAQLEFSFKLSEFDVGVPSYMGVTVADAVTIRGEVVAQEVIKP